jgi:leucyl-tRNA synthetase
MLISVNVMGAPIPIVYVNTVSEVPVPEEDYRYYCLKTGFRPGGPSPLARSSEFVNTLPPCGGKSKRETETMIPFLLFLVLFALYFPKAKNEPFLKENVDYWMPVDQ